MKSYRRNCGSTFKRLWLISVKQVCTRCRTWCRSWRRMMGAIKYSVSSNTSSTSTWSAWLHREILACPSIAWWKTPIWRLWSNARAVCLTSSLSCRYMPSSNPTRLWRMRMVGPTGSTATFVGSSSARTKSSKYGNNCVSKMLIMSSCPFS